MAHQDTIRLDSPEKVFVITFLIVFLFRAVPEVRNLSNGFYYLIIAITLCFVTDIMAYLVGKAIGKHKLLPKVSPNKTVEGSIGGILGAVLIMLILGKFLNSSTDIIVKYGLMILYTVLASIVGQFGDLAMSCIKRICGIKDFGNLLPGHGGMLDRFDSHMFSIAFSLLFCTATGGYLS